MSRLRYPSESDPVTGKSAISIYCTSSPEMVLFRAGQKVRSVPIPEFPRSRSLHARQYIQYFDRTAEKHRAGSTDGVAAPASETLAAISECDPRPFLPDKRAVEAL